MNFQEFLDILWEQESSGENGFEGLVCKLLENLTGQRFFISLSGRQDGRDTASEGRIYNFIAAECKRYKDDTPLSSDALLAKLIRAVNSTPPPDIWIVVTTKRLGEQHHRDLQNASDRFGISYFSIDAEGDESSPLAALCAVAPNVVTVHLKSNLTNMEDAKAVEIEEYLSSLNKNEACSCSIDKLKKALLQDFVGYAHLQREQNGWLLTRLESQKESLASFAQDLAVKASENKVVIRNNAQKVLNNWWETWPKEQKSITILGEEGDGKSWAVADWLADKIKSDKFPPVVFIPATRISEMEPIDLTIETLRWQIGEPRADYWKNRLNRWLNNSYDGQPAFLLVIDGLNEHPGFGWRF